MSVDFGLALVESHPKTARLNQWMEDLDAQLPKLVGHFKSLWMTDHLFWNDWYSYESWTVLSFLAGRWKQFDVGPMVIGQNYRNPALLAKMAATLQVFSEGRYIMSIGAGWKEDEYKAFNYDLPSAKVRLEQLVDTLEICQRLWTLPGKVTYHGAHYQINDAILEPKPVPPPTVCLGVKGDRAMAIAAKYADWWNISDVPLPQFIDRVNKLAQECEAIGRDPASIRKTWFGRICLGKTEAAALKRGDGWLNNTFNHDNAIVGTPAQVVEQLQGYVAAGCTYFMLDVVGFPNEEPMQMMLEDVIPKVRG